MYKSFIKPFDDLIVFVGDMCSLDAFIGLVTGQCRHFRSLEYVPYLSKLSSNASYKEYKYDYDVVSHPGTWRNGPNR